MKEKFYFDEEEGVVLSSELTAEIEAKAEKLSAENPKVRKVFPVVVIGQPHDEKDIYVGYLKQPDLKAFSKYLTASQKDGILAQRVLAKDCFLDGDKELVEDDNLFLFGLMGQMGQIIEMRQGKLVNLSKPGK